MCCCRCDAISLDHGWLIRLRKSTPSRMISSGLHDLASYHMMLLVRQKAVAGFHVMDGESALSGSTRMRKIVRAGLEN
ncbi:hypothetical protein BHM03_00062297 [Ensete ventricosum]|nr:hypothetical protein BHM03_00062297 [Ensete ventricosum]